MKHRWRFLVAALAGTTVLAVGFGLAVDQLLAGNQPAPQLRSVSAASLAGVGLTLAPAAQPPFCGAAQRAASSGWLQPGFGGCAISREAAERVSVASSSQVVETLLARVTTTNRQPALHNRLAWLVVVRGKPEIVPAIAIICQPTSGCGSLPTAHLSSLRVMVLDGITGQFLAIVSPGVQQAPIPWILQAPSPPRPPFVIPPPTGAPSVRDSPRLVPPQGN